MQSRIGIGRYSPTKTWLHKVDPRVKLLVNIFLIGACFVFHDLIALGILSLFSLLIFISLGQGIGYPLGLVLKSIIPITVFVFIIYSWMMPPTGNVFLESKHFSISEDGIKVSCRVALRIFVMFMVATICTLTTAAISLTRAIEDLLTPLK